MKISIIKNLFFLSGCFLITVFIFLSSYETLFNKDIKYIYSIEPVNIGNIINTLTSDKGNDFPVISVQPDFVGKYGIPSMIKMPNLDKKIQLTGAIRYEKQKWLAKSNSGHYLFTSANKDGKSGDMVIYIRKSWRTLEEVDNISARDNIFIDTLDEWRYVFRINETAILADEKVYIATQTKDPSLIIIINDEKNNINYLFKANFLSVQNIEK